MSYLSKVVLNVSNRTIEIYSDDDQYEVVQFKWDEEGAEGFAEQMSLITQNVSSDMVEVNL